MFTSTVVWYNSWYGSNTNKTNIMVVFYDIVAVATSKMVGLKHKFTGHVISKCQGQIGSEMLSYRFFGIRS